MVPGSHSQFFRLESTHLIVFNLRLVDSFNDYHSNAADCRHSPNPLAFTNQKPGAGQRGWWQGRRILPLSSGCLSLSLSRSVGVCSHRISDVRAGADGGLRRQALDNDCPGKNSASKFKTQTTVGIMLTGLKIDSMVNAAC